MGHQKKKIVLSSQKQTYQKILAMAKASGMTKRDADALFAAYKQALMSEFGSQKLGCVITCGNVIVGAGRNSEKTTPMQKAYNLKYREFIVGPYSNREHSFHAEISALSSIPYPTAQQMNWKKAKAYIYRIAPGLEYEQGIAAPCSACAHALADAGIRRVVFSTDYGFATSRLDISEGLLKDPACISSAQEHCFSMHNDMQ